MVETSTAPFALSTAGNGSTSDVIAGTRHCADPVVLIQPAGNRTVYIASTLDDDRTTTERGRPPPARNDEAAARDVGLRLFRWPGAGSNRRPSDFQSDARTN